MFDKINNVKRQYTYAVQPVKLFENNNTKQQQAAGLSDFNKQINRSPYNPFHPSVENSAPGGKLDILG